MLLSTIICGNWSYNAAICCYLLLSRLLLLFANIYCCLLLLFAALHSYLQLFTSVRYDFLPFILSSSSLLFAAMRVPFSKTCCLIALLRPTTCWEKVASISSYQLLGKICQHFGPGRAGKKSPGFRPRYYRKDLASISSQEFYWETLASIPPLRLHGNFGQHIFQGVTVEKLASISSKELLGHAQ